MVKVLETAVSSTSGEERSLFSCQEQGEDVEEKEDEKPVESPKKTEKNEVNSVSCYKVSPEPIVINGVKWDPYKWPYKWVSLGL